MLAKSLALLVLAASAAYVVASDESRVTKLSSSDFAEKTADGKVYFIKFFAPWCGHCKRLAPTWGELAEDLKEHADIVIAQVDCTVDKDVCSKAEIRGYPTLKVYHGGEAKEQYRGSRELSALKEFIQMQKTTLLDETTE